MDPEEFRREKPSYSGPIIPDEGNEHAKEEENELPVPEWISDQIGNH